MRMYDDPEWPKGMSQDEQEAMRKKVDYLIENGYTEEPPHRIFAKLLDAYNCQSANASSQ